MAEPNKTGKFTTRAQAILSQDHDQDQPTGLVDLMGQGNNAGLTESRQIGKPMDRQKHNQIPRVRLEVRIPEDLSEALRDYIYEHRTSKAQAVTEALRQFLEVQSREPTSR